MTAYQNGGPTGRLVVPPEPPQWPHRSPLAERILTIVREVLTIVALILAIVIMAGVIRFAAAAADSLDRLKSPDPAVTGCPFGEGECGG